MNSELAVVYYNLRCNYYQTVVAEAEKFLLNYAEKSEKHGKLSFWKACAMGLGGLHQNAIQELEIMKSSYRHLEYAIVSAQIWFHQKDEFVDEDELQKLNVALGAAQSCMHVEGALLSADFHLHVSDYAAMSQCLKHPVVIKAKNSIDNSRVKRKVEIERCRIHVWSIIMSGSDISHNYMINSSVLENKDHYSENIDLMMIQAKYHECCGNLTSSLDILAKAILINDSFYPAMIENSKLHFRQQQYRLAREFTHRALCIDKDNAEALQLFILIELIVGGGKGGHIEKLKQLVKVLCFTKITHKKSCFRSAQLFSRLCGNQDRISLELVLTLISKASDLDPTDASVRLEKAQILRRLEKYQEAISEFQFILSMNESNIDAFHGMVRCQILNGNLSDAKDQLEFISLMDDQGKSTLERHIINVLLGESKHDVKNRMYSMFEALLIQTTEVQSIPRYDVFDLKFYLDVGDSVDMIRYYLTKWSSGSHGIAGISNHDEWEALTGKVIKLLNVIIDQYPSNVHAWVLMAKMKFQLCEMSEAEMLLEHCESIHPNSGLSFLIKAQIQLGSNDLNSSQQSLERALSEDFEIRCHPLYSLVKGSLCLKKGNDGEAKELLEETIKSKTVNNGGFRDKFIVSLDDRLSCYLEYSKALKATNDLVGLESVIRHAEQIFRGIPRSFHFTTLKSGLYLEQKNPKKALRVFSEICPESPFFVAAQLELAKLYLHYERDLKSFIQCHESLMKVEEVPKVQTYLALGDAYMEATFYTKALSAYKEALAMSPDKEKIVRNVGNVLIFCNEYEKAIDYFEAFLQKVPDNVGMILDLASLYMNYHQLQKACEVLTSLADSDSLGWKDHIMLSLKFAQIYLSKGDYVKSKGIILDTLTSYNTKHMKRTKSKDDHEEVQEMISSFIVDLVEKDTQSNPVEGLAFCQAVIEFIGNDEGIVFVYSKLLFQVGKFDECRTFCEKILVVNPTHEGVIILLGNIYINQSKFDEALVHYKEFLNGWSCNYMVAFEYLRLLGRMDRVNQCKKIIESFSCHQSCRGKLCFGGRNLCMGLYHRLTGNLPLALTHFNQARFVQKWRKEACANMIEIYLRLDEYDFWMTKKNIQSASKCDINSIEILLQEFSNCDTDQREIKLYNGYLKLLSSFQIDEIENDIEEFHSLSSSEKEYVPALLGVSIFHQLKGNTTKLRNTLKRIAKHPYRPEIWREFEKGYLMLATIYTERGKTELAQDLCKRCLFYNKSCKKAWEIMGSIMTGRDNKAEAINCYKQNWNLGNKSSLSIGSRLALLHFKNKEFSKAIDVATQVLKDCPDYPQMTNILEKCVWYLRG